MKTVCRLAPSPTGRMHAGNIFSSLVSWLIAKSSDGEVVLRIEDLDEQRSKREFVEQVQRDYELLGLTWDRGPFYQASNTEAYQSAFDKLFTLGLVYPCYCSRADLLASSAPQGDGLNVYAGTCRGLTEDQRVERQKLLLLSGKVGPSFRMKVDDRTITFHDLFCGDCSWSLMADSGDFVIRRADGLYAYQLAVTVDDCDQGITTVVRGNDLLSSVCRQRCIQDALGMSHVEYAHVPLLIAPDGRRLAKRDHDAHLDVLLERYKTPEAVLGKIAFVTGLVDEPDPVSAEDLLAQFDIERCRTLWSDRRMIVWGP